jgi:hypothetical protein
MVSTVTVTTVTTIAAVSFIATLSIMGVILLIGLLVSKELLSASDGSRSKFVGRVLNIGIIPLVLSFSVIVVLKIIEILA